MKTPRSRPSLYVFCPSYALQGPAERDRYLNTARGWARRMSWRMSPSPLLEHYLGPSAWLPAQARAADLTPALKHDILWACRGGYGCIDLIRPLLSARSPAKKPRLIGYSDVTVLHAAWRVRGWGETYYGNLGDAEPGTRAAATLLPLLRGQSLHVDASSECAVRVLNPGRASGPSFVACLTVLAGLCGTPALPDLNRHILFIEDIDERAYQLDFALNQLWLSGALDGVRALVGGAFPAPQSPDYQGPETLDVLRLWGQRLGIPVLARLPFGHRADALFLPVGRQTDLAAQEDGTWTVRFRARRTP